MRPASATLRIPSRDRAGNFPARRRIKRPGAFSSPSTLHVLLAPTKSTSQFDKSLQVKEVVLSQREDIEAQHEMDAQRAHELSSVQSSDYGSAQNLSSPSRLYYSETLGSVVNESSANERSASGKDLSQRKSRRPATRSPIDISTEIDTIASLRYASVLPRRSRNVVMRRRAKQRQLHQARKATMRGVPVETQLLETRSALKAEIDEKSALQEKLRHLRHKAELCKKFEVTRLSRKRDESRVRELQFQIQIEKQRSQQLLQRIAQANDAKRRISENGALRTTQMVSGMDTGTPRLHRNYALKNQYVDRVGDRSTEQSAGSSHEHLFSIETQNVLNALAGRPSAEDDENVTHVVEKSESDNRLTLELLAKEAARPSMEGTKPHAIIPDEPPMAPPTAPAESPMTPSTELISTPPHGSTEVAWKAPGKDYSHLPTEECQNGPVSYIMASGHK